MKSSIKSFLSVLSSNIYNLAIGIVLGFIIPKLLGPTDYGYWSVFTLYISYAGLLIIGLADGLYLNYGGYEYEKLEKDKIRSYYYVMLVYLIALVIIFNIVISFIEMTYDYRVIFRFLSIGSFLTCINSFLILINQATARFKIYSFANIIPKTVIGIATIFIVIIHNTYYVVPIIGNILGLIISNLYLAYNSKEIILGRPKWTEEVFNGIITNISAGLSLTIAGVASMLMMGFGKIIIERKLGAEALGYYSFAFSLTSIFTQVIYAISTVIYPLVKRKKGEIDSIFSVIDNSIIAFSGIILLLYYPCRFLLNILFKDYSNGFACVLYLFPIVVCDARIILTYSSKFKIERKERTLLYVLLISISINAIITVILFSIFKSIEIVALSTYIGFEIWLVLLATKNNSFNATIDYLFKIIFVVINLLFEWSITNFVTITIVFVIIYILKRNFIKDNIKKLSLCLKG